MIRPADWPGVNCVEALCRGKRLSGVWYDRTRQYEAERADEEVSSAQFAERVAVPLSPLPCLTGLSVGQQRSRYRALVRDIEIETQRRVARGGKRMLGARQVRAQSPHKRPRQVKRSPAPLCHASEPQRRRRYRDDLRWFTSLYRDAARRLRAGDFGVSFPAHCFPPALAYVGLDPPG